MHVRNNTPGFVKSTYKGMDSDGLHVYTQPKMWFPKNPKVAFNRVLSNAVKNGYQKISHPNLQGPALMSKRLNRVISDFGENGQGQVGWYYGGAGIGDAAFETIPEFTIAMEKKGGKLIPKNRKGGILKCSNGEQFPLSTYTPLEIGATADPTRAGYYEEMQRQEQAKKDYYKQLNSASFELLYNTLAMFDPTGISSWPDVYNSVVQASEDGNWTNEEILAVTWSIIGALPMVGKVTAPVKLAKTAERVLATSPKLTNKILRCIEKGNSVIDSNKLAKIANQPMLDLTSEGMNNILTKAPMVGITSDKGLVKTVYGLNSGAILLNTSNTVSDASQIFSSLINLYNVTQ